MDWKLFGKGAAAAAGVALVAGVALSQLYGVKVVASLNGQSDRWCPPEAPIQISVTNYTFRRVARVSVELEGWRDGDSSNILGSRGYAFTAVVKPFKSRIACYSDAAFGSFKQGPGVELGERLEATNQYMRLAEGVELVVVDYQVTFL